ncbi:hypothetical protein [Pseudoalteromonas sp. NCIMB_1079]|uniref:hypothetical protein n=1 Tax=Pseudoalteromonas sp. NCIMB 1079 TaxID=3142847 RepID=UPI00339BE180
MYTQLQCATKIAFFYRLLCNKVCNLTSKYNIVLAINHLDVIQGLEMGLILGPAVLAWFALFIYSLRLGYVLIYKNMSVLTTVSTFAISIVGMLAFMTYGHRQFVNNTSVWASEIPSYFLFSKIAFIGVLSGFLLNYYINPENSSEFLSCLAFVLIFMFSAGVLASLGGHEAFLKEFDIKTTH